MYEDDVLCKVCYFFVVVYCVFIEFDNNDCV